MLKNKKVKMGMVGGGKGAFIGVIHRAAAALDSQIELVAGAFSSNHQNCIDTGESLGVSPQRCYPTYQAMFAAEAELPADQRMDFVVIVTPNFLHFPVAKCALEHGFHVLSDKPATMNLPEALLLEDIVKQHNRLYGLTHTYTGYPLVKEACYRVQQGELGDIVKVIVEYSQGWLGSADDESSKQASWRLDPAKSGSSCCMGDIGVHAANLAEYISNLHITEVCADLNTLVNGRTLDDDGTVLLKFDNGAKGVLLASQVAIGEENNLSIRIYGTKASFEWRQQEPNSLYKKYQNQPMQVIRTGVANLSPEVNSLLRTPAGHPEGYIEAFANIYLQFIEQVRHFNSETHHHSQSVPGITEAVRGMAFIDSVVAASKQSNKWYPMLNQAADKE
ncbi:Gfo/Idh/MocA family protein [Shewanella gaetbuli]|uniref:Gfo/Idh/MocA family oxidoreductase n=1 Tax=Shewanella gaetbuli TaxID=220752 RepID=A0A9X1ZNU4_9GAMM|nr:Gfo/Idh/MocA family oxidoreductase [Shewanella gaetbuli]MCL1142885.1 Gfo/Idh/MocA family oxidoreductase [Shewanella gaetbuli]